MKVDRRAFRKISLSAIVITGFVTAFEISIFAQSSRTITSVERRVDQMKRQGEQFERDSMNRELNGKNRKAADSKRTQAIKAQIKEDFAALQSAYNDIVVSLQSGGAAVDRDFVLEAASDIKKYAVRLKENLALPKPEKDAVDDEKKEDLNLDDRRKSLLALCQHIYNFVTNPIFNEPTTGLDIDLAAKAGREMDKIIELSEKIKETAEKTAN